MLETEEYEYAGFWLRVAASLIDTFLLAIIIIPLTIIIYENYWHSEVVILGGADFLINVVFPFFVVMLFWFYKSATPGKMVLNIKIVNADDGTKLSVGQCVGRYFAYIPAMLPLFIGIFWVGFDKRKQGWHDKLAKTLVIRQKKKVQILSGQNENNKGVK